MSGMLGAGGGTGKKQPGWTGGGTGNKDAGWGGMATKMPGGGGGKRRCIKLLIAPGPRERHPLLCTCCAVLQRRFSTPEGGEGPRGGRIGTQRPPRSILPQHPDRGKAKKKEKQKRNKTRNKTKQENKEKCSTAGLHGEEKETTTSVEKRKKERKKQKRRRISVNIEGRTWPEPGQRSGPGPGSRKEANKHRTGQD